MSTDWAWTDRFWAKVEEDPTTGCWLWRASLASGYGRYTTRHYPRSGSAHRIAYELVIGLIPEGLTLHHRCRVPACVNPAHLEPMRMGENALLGGGPAALNARKTHCHRGHPLSGENLKVRPGEGRRCLTCYRERRREYMRRWSQTKKGRAKVTVRGARRRGDLVPAEMCELCDQPAEHMHAHHEDYDRPLDVRWLCARCHATLHRGSEANV
jgi:hypothetical protein